MPSKSSFIDIVRDAILAARRAGQEQCAALEMAALAVMNADLTLSLGAARLIVSSRLPAIGQPERDVETVPGDALATVMKCDPTMDALFARRSGTHGNGGGVGAAAAAPSLRRGWRPPST